ncbi:hypothetical protein WN982_15960 [Paraburkholderia sp. IMGN_8]
MIRTGTSSSSRLDRRAITRPTGASEKPPAQQTTLDMAIECMDQEC